MQFPSTTLQAMEVRPGDVLAVGGEVTATKSRPMPGVGGGVLLTFVDGSERHLANRATVIATDLAVRASSLA
jgi:hypothetical protein